MQGRHVEAAALYRKALAVRLAHWGRPIATPRTAMPAWRGIWTAQGKHVEAEALHRKALAIRLGVLGEEHPLTAASYNDLASNLDAQGKLAEAVASWTAAASIAERCRGRRSVSGIERSLASASAARSRPGPGPGPAGQVPRRLGPLGKWPGSRFARRLLRTRGPALDARRAPPRSRAVRRVTAARRTDRPAGRPDRAHGGRGQGTRRPAERAERPPGPVGRVSDRAGPEVSGLCGQAPPLEDVQKTLPADAALVGWLDSTNHHAACVIRRDREPVWVHVTRLGS